MNRPMTITSSLGVPCSMWTVVGTRLSPMTRHAGVATLTTSLHALNVIYMSNLPTEWKISEKNTIVMSCKNPIG